MSNSSEKDLSWWDSVTSTVAKTGEVVGGAITIASGTVVNTAVSAGSAVGGAVVGAGSAVGGAVVGAGSAVGDAALSATDGVGYLFNLVSNNPQLKEVTEAFQVDWLIRLIERVDIVKAETEVKRLQKKYPNELPYQIAQRIITDKAMYAGGLGLASSLVPGAAVAMFAVDLAATTLVQAEMTYQIAAAYGLDLKDPARKGEILAIFGLALGGSQALKVGGEYALKAGLGFLRNIPVAGAVIGAGTNAIMLYALGNGACQYYEAKTNPLSTSKTLEAAEQEGTNFLKAALSQEVIVDQILVHLFITSHPGATWSSILPELQILNLSPASLEVITENAKSPPSLGSLLDQLNRDFAIALLAQAKKVSLLDAVITREEKTILSKIAQKFDIKGFID